MSLLGRKWRVLTDWSNSDELLANMLVSRGVTDPKAQEKFLSPHAELLHDPYLFTDMQKVVVRKECRQWFWYHVVCWLLI